MHVDLTLQAARSDVLAQVLAVLEPGIDAADYGTRFSVLNVRLHNVDANGRFRVRIASAAPAANSPGILIAPGEVYEARGLYYYGSTKLLWAWSVNGSCRALVELVTE